MIEPDEEGGLFQFAFQLCRALGEAGHQTFLVTGRKPEMSGDAENFRLLPIMRLWSRSEVMSARQQSSRAAVAFFAARRVYRGLKLTVAWIRALRLARKLGPDVIVLSMILHPHIQAMVRRLVPSRVVLAQVCHEFVDRDLGASGSASPSPLIERFDRVFLLSEAGRQEFIAATGVAADKTTRIPHGSQDALVSDGPGADAIRARLAIAPDTPVLLFFGVLRRSKGLEDLLDAFAASTAQPEAKLVIAGRATKYIRLGDIEDRIARLGLEDRVVLHNTYIENAELAGFFEMARAVALPYRSASASGVLHLAYTCERPVVATSVGGLAEDVIDGETGFLVPPEDPPALARAIDAIMADPERAAEMGRRGKALSAETYSWKNAARIVSDALAEDLKAPDRSHRRPASLSRVS